MDDIVLLVRDQVELHVMLDVMGNYMMKGRFRFNQEAQDNDGRWKR